MPRHTQKTKKRTFGLTTRQRQYRHVLESALDRGADLADAKALAARVVNRFRAKQAARHRGPKLVTKGGSRRQWYPGKKVAKEVFVCLKHGRPFKTEAALLTHYRSH